MNYIINVTQRKSTEQNWLCERLINIIPPTRFTTEKKIKDKIDIKKQYRKKDMPVDLIPYF